MSKNTNHQKSLPEDRRCNYTYHMEDPWYMVFCDKKKGHSGLHRYQWEKDRE